MAPVQVHVFGLAGPLCTIAAEDEWSVGQVMAAVAERTQIPVLEQVMLEGCRILSNEECQAAKLASVLSAKAHTMQAAAPPSGSAVQLTLVRQEKPQSLAALHDAIVRRNAPAALELLDKPRLSGIGNPEPASGFSVLHAAALFRLEEVALRILARTDFKAINAKWGGGPTALHIAARLGLQRFCRATVARPDFTELQTPLPEGCWVGRRGETAYDIAQGSGHPDIAALLLEAADGAGRHG